MSQPSAAYTAALETAAVFDRSAVGKLTLIGPDAVPFLHNLCTNDIKSLAVGDGCEAYLCDPRAKVQHQIWVFRIENGLWVETVPGRAEALFKALDRYLISERVEMADVTDPYSQFLVVGPKAKRAVESAFGPMTLLTEFQSVVINQLRIARRETLGVEGYSVTCLSAERTSVLQRLTDAGAVLGDTETYETLRVEAGSPAYGKDIDDTRFVMEVARAERAVSYAKGCFPGQEPIVMSRDRAGFVNRAFLGMKVLSGGLVASGTKLTRDGTDVGVITSSVFSPRLNAPVAIGYVKRGHQDRGTKLKAGDQDVEVLGFPPLGSVTSP